MWRVRTASRLHFGLLSVAGEGENWPDRQGKPTLAARRFGSVGLMVDAPGIQLRAEPASDWSAGPQGSPLAGRALEFARRFLASMQAEEPQSSWPARRLVLESAAPEHAGLGTGTQLGLAVARVLARSWGKDFSAPELALRVGRGKRSGLGVHGFEQGGFLVDGGRGAGPQPAPLLARVAFPEEWRVVLALPASPSGLHGSGEVQAFARLTHMASVRNTDAMCRLALLGLLPALIESDLKTFGGALYDFNARAGEAFASEQGGIYSGQAVTDLVGFIRQQGIQGVGQSSWGPTVFAVVGDEEHATDLSQRLRAYLGPKGTVWVTHGVNHGAEEQA